MIVKSFIMDVPAPILARSPATEQHISNGQRMRVLYCHCVVNLLFKFDSKYCLTNESVNLAYLQCQTPFFCQISCAIQPHPCCSTGAGFLLWSFHSECRKQEQHCFWKDMLRWQNDMIRLCRKCNLQLQGKLNVPMQLVARLIVDWDSPRAH